MLQENLLESINNAKEVAELSRLTLQAVNNNSQLLEKIIVILSQSREVSMRIEERQLEALKKSQDINFSCSVF